MLQRNNVLYLTFCFGRMKTLGHVVSVEVRKTLSIIIFRISVAVLNLSQIYFFVFYDAIMELEHPFLLAEASHDES